MSFEEDSFPDHALQHYLVVVKKVIQDSVGDATADR
jgi:hypothetical protein